MGWWIYCGEILYQSASGDEGKGWHPRTSGALAPFCVTMSRSFSWQALQRILGPGVSVPLELSVSSLLLIMKSLEIHSRCSASSLSSSSLPRSLQNPGFAPPE